MRYLVDSIQQREGGVKVSRSETPSLTPASASFGVCFPYTYLRRWESRDWSREVPYGQAGVVWAELRCLSTSRSPSPPSMM